MDDEIELKEVVRKLREDLLAAAEEGQDKGIKFKLESIDLELKVAAKKVGGVEAGVKFYVFNFGAKGQVENEQALTLKLKLTPERPDGGPVQVAKKTAERPGTP